MRALTISRHKLEIARFQLGKPVITVGRSPACDIVLRAPGVRPVHFLVEWIGAGKFQAQEGQWSLFDFSSSNEEDAQGIVLSEEPRNFSGYNFSCVDPGFEAKETIGGQIRENLSRFSQTNRERVLELIHMRKDSGAVEQVLHLRPGRWRRRRREPLGAEVPIDIEWKKDDAGEHVVLHWKGGTELQLFNKGKRLVAERSHVVQASDLLQLRWHGREVFVRHVERLSVLRDKRLARDPLLRRLSLGGAVLGLALFLMARGNSVESEAAKGPRRVATVEIKQLAQKAEPVPPPPPVAAMVAEKAGSRESSPGVKERPRGPEHRQALAKGTRPAQPGTPAKQADLTTIGVLGALSRSSSKGAGVRADMIMNEGIASQTASAENEASAIVVQKSPSGVLGIGKGGNQGSGSPGLDAASTRISGSGRSSLEASGPITREGTGGYQLGTDLLGGGNGTGTGTAGIGADGGFSVNGGGLDRETVRRTIASHRGQIRTCYERVLLTTANLSGRIVYEWSIAPTGKVQGARILSTTLEPTGLQPCVLEVITQMTFPKALNGLETKVIYPFVFQMHK